MGIGAMWGGMGRGARWSLGVGVAVVLAGTVTLGYWALRTDYAVLFANLSPQDASAMTHELDQMKVPYQLSDDGGTILVDSHSVPQTRMKLLGKDLPLHGAVGFELFNNSDFGMTEFAQKVNYQRALQGELTRTILSLSEVAAVRVHLAFPQDSLFKRDQDHSKASVTLTLKDGKALRRDQVRGIQRLVAAAVPGIEARDVTLVNDQGVALTQGDDAEPAGAASARLELKREIEQYLAQKANAVLDKAFGPAQAFASVDVTLDLNQVKVTTEDVTAPAGSNGEGPVGLVLHERETVRETGREGASNPSDTSAPSNVNREVDYQLGRRVEQVISTPGAIAKLQVLAVLRMPLSATQTEQASQLVGSSVGASRERGDVVVVQPLMGLAGALADAPRPAQGEMGATQPLASAAAPLPPVRVAAGQGTSISVVQVIELLLALVVLGLAAVFLRGRARSRRLQTAVMSEGERELALAQLKTWLHQDAATPGSGSR